MPFSMRTLRKVLRVAVAGWIGFLVVCVGVSGLVVCVGPDGHVAVETVHDGHCHAEQDDDACTGSPAAGHDGTFASECASPCIDVVLPSESVVSSAPRTKKGNPQRSLLPVFASGCPSVLAPADPRAISPETRVGHRAAPSMALILQRTTVLRT